MSKHGEADESFGGRLRRLREGRGLSLDGLAARSGLSKGYLWRLETGADPNPSIGKLEALRVGLDVPAESLLTRPTPPKAAAEVAAEVLLEVERASRKFPTWPTDPLHAVAIVGEEAGELTKAVVQAVYEPHKSGLVDVRAEAVQTAAMAIRFLLSLGRYEFEPCAQHAQNGSA